MIADLEKANTLFNSTAGLRYNTEGEFLFGTSDVLVSGQISRNCEMEKVLQFTASSYCFATFECEQSESKDRA